MREPRTASGTGPDAPAAVAGADGRRRAPLAWLWAALVLVVVVALDQLSKHAIETSIVPGEEQKVLPGIQLVDTRNKGVAFGFFPGNHLLVTILIGLALAVLLAYFARHASRTLMWLPTGMIAGGALGNVLDRLRHGSVTDFIKLPLGWPPFNLADSSITLGVLILFIVIDRSRQPHPAQAQPRPRAERQ
jgi:signal peptidase II